MTELRSVATLDELRACVALQRTTWGEEFYDIVPASVLQVSQKVGGFVGGAFEDEALVGFVYSLFGRFEGVLSHWSHMLAVEPAARGRGLGRRLKLFQREALLADGMGTMFWTYDPMVARNAHLNLNRLGASVLRYVPNMYGSDTGSPLHAGGETDRFIVRWDLESERALAAIAGETSPGPGLADAETVVGRPDPTRHAGQDLPEDDDVLVEVPADVESLPADEALVNWRESVRDAFLEYLRRGYVVQSLVRDAEANRCFYHLRRS